jgi:transposase-like protein
MTRKRRTFTSEKKLQIVKEGLQKDVKIAELCRLYDIYPTDFYKWKKQAEMGMKEGFKTKKKDVILSNLEQKQEDEIKRLESVLIQLTKEHLDLKKKVYG